MTRLVAWAIRLAVGLVALVALLAGVTYAVTYHPGAVEAGSVTCPSDAPTLERGQQVRVMSWNIQYLAGRGYVFWYDVPGGDGPDRRPTKGSLARTLQDITDAIQQEDPDVVLLQEVDRSSARTDGADQLAQLTARLAGAYPCTASAYYWKSRFVPHPKVMGQVGMSLGVLSKTSISSATRYQLPHICGDPVTVAFNFDRAVLATELEVAGGDPLTVLDTHLDAFAQGCDTMERQVAAVQDVIAGVEGPWVLGGDFNLLATRSAYDRLAKPQRALYAPTTELTPLLDDYRHFPTTEQVEAGDPAYFTQFPNDPDVKRPDRTIDYFFYSDGLRPRQERVRQDQPKLSDHFALLTTITVP
jgi:endonuclease/exonuclease/phosphatase family metal-dependent hydrolase